MLSRPGRPWVRANPRRLLSSPSHWRSGRLAFDYRRYRGPLCAIGPKSPNSLIKKALSRRLLQRKAPWWKKAIRGILMASPAAGWGEMRERGWEWTVGDERERWPPPSRGHPKYPYSPLLTSILSLPSPVLSCSQDTLPSPPWLPSQLDAEGPHTSHSPLPHSSTWWNLTPKPALDLAEPDFQT